MVVSEHGRLPPIPPGQASPAIARHSSVSLSRCVFIVADPTLPPHRNLHEYSERNQRVSPSIWQQAGLLGLVVLTTRLFRAEAGRGGDADFSLTIGNYFYRSLDMCSAFLCVAGERQPCARGTAQEVIRRRKSRISPQWSWRRDLSFPGLCNLCPHES